MSKLYFLNVYWLSAVLLKIHVFLDVTLFSWERLTFRISYLLFFSTAQLYPEDGAMKTIRNARSYSLNGKASHLRNHGTSFTNSCLYDSLFIYLLILCRHLYELVHINKLAQSHEDRWGGGDGVQFCYTFRHQMLVSGHLHTSGLFITSERSQFLTDTELLLAQFQSEHRGGSNNLWRSWK